MEEIVVPQIQEPVLNEEVHTTRDAIPDENYGRSIRLEKFLGYEWDGVEMSFGLNTGIIDPVVWLYKNRHTNWIYSAVFQENNKMDIVWSDYFWEGMSETNEIQPTEFIELEHSRLAVPTGSFSIATDRDKKYLAAINSALSGIYPNRPVFPNLNKVEFPRRLVRTIYGEVMNERHLSLPRTTLEQLLTDLNFQVKE